MTMCALSVQSDTAAVWGQGPDSLMSHPPRTSDVPPSPFPDENGRKEVRGERHGCSENVLEELPLLSLIPIG